MSQQIEDVQALINFKKTISGNQKDNFVVERSLNPDLIEEAAQNIIVP